MMTRHRDIQALLSDHVLGELPDDTDRVVRDHLASCRECREWTHTVRLAASTRAESRPQGAGGHPTGEELAAYVVGEPALEFERWQAVERHLEACSLCTEEVSLCEEALAAGDPARPWEPERGEPAAHPSGRSPARRGAIAAAAALALLVAGLLALDRGGDPDRGQSLAGDRLTGRRVIEVSGALAANRLRIEPGAHITLRAESVALGDGFSVDQDAELVIDGTPRRSR
jgi:hypothetical protein